MVQDLLVFYLPWLVFLLIPWLCIAAFMRMGKSTVLAALLSFFVISTISIGALVLDNRSTQQVIDRMDRNHDGIFSIEEEASWSVEERKAMDHYIGDGGRNIAGVIIIPGVGLIYSIFCAVMAHVFLWGNKFLKRKIN